MMRGKKRALAAAAVAVVATVAIAGAHQPWFNLQGSPDPAAPYQLNDLDISQVVYGGLADEGRVDWYAFTIEDPWQSDFGIVVPDIELCASFRPNLVLIGPGVASEGELPDGLTLPSAAATPGVLVASLETWGEFYEPYSQTLYATGPDLAVDLAPGDYLLAVVEPDGDPGTYGLTLGGAEIRGGESDPEKWGLVLTCDPPPVATPEPATATP